MIIAFLSGVLAMSVFATITLYLVDDGKDWGTLLCGPASWIVMLFSLVSNCIQYWKEFHGKNMGC